MAAAVVATLFVPAKPTVKVKFVLPSPTAKVKLVFAKLAAATERRIDVSDAQAPPSPPAPDAPTVPTNYIEIPMKILDKPEPASDRMAARVGASGK